MSGYSYIYYKAFKPRQLHFNRQRGYSKHPQYTASSFISLDTETSKIEDDNIGWLYQWCFSYPGSGERLLVYGRRPSELAEALLKVVIVNKLTIREDYTLPIYVHNLAYDYTYIHDYIKLYFRQALGEEVVNDSINMLATGPHKIISWSICGLVFKCSYRLSQKSLDGWCKELNTPHKKLVGEIDYNVIRYQDTPLNRSDWRYMFRDVICLDEAITLQLTKWKDDLKTIPLTMTGYVRRKTRYEYKKDPRNRKLFKDKELNVHLYRLLRAEFSGGLTHGNRFYANRTLVGEGKPGRKPTEVTIDGKKQVIKHIRHGDFVSMYPSEQMTGGAPVSHFWLYHEHEECGYSMKLDKLIELTKKYCILASITLSNVEIRKGVTLPYLQVSKLRAGHIDSLDMVEDNGRLLKMISGHSTIVVNEHDLHWISKQYTFQYMINEVYIAERGPYPTFIKNTILRFFEGKSKYKALEKQLIKDGYDEMSAVVRAVHLDLMINKSLLNGIYGMCSTDPVRVSYDEDELTGEWYVKPMTEEDVEEKLKHFFDNENNFLNYEYGCWTTSLARHKLMSFVELVGYDRFIYADTDSIFYISDDIVESRLKAANDKMMQDNIDNHWYIEHEGKRDYFNQFEDEGEDIRSFRFLHAKCYAYESMEDGELKLHTTIAGVKAKGLKSTRVKELGSIDNLEGGKVFEDCGGTSCTYVAGKPDVINVNGHDTEVASAAIIKHVNKTLTAEINLGADIWYIEKGEEDG